MRLGVVVFGAILIKKIDIRDLQASMLYLFEKEIVLQVGFRLKISIRKEELEEIWGSIPWKCEARCRSTRRSNPRRRAFPRRQVHPKHQTHEMETNRRKLDGERTRRDS